MLVFIEISTLNPTFGAIMPKKFITANSVQCDPIMTPLENLFFCFIYLFPFGQEFADWINMAQNTDILF